MAVDTASQTPSFELFDLAVTMSDSPAGATGRRGPLLALAASQVMGQLCLLAVTPFLTRHYDSGVIGTYQLILTTVLVLSPVATLRAELPIPGPIGNSAVRRLRSWATGSILIVSGLFGVLGAIALVRQASAIGFLLAGVLIAVTAVSTLDSALLIRRWAIWTAATRNLIAGALAAGLQIAFAHLDNALLALGGALVVGRLVALVVTLRPHRLDVDDANQSTSSGGSEAGSPLELAASIISGVVSTAGAHLPILIFGLTSSAHTLGQLAVATRLSSAPLSILGIALTQVVVARFGATFRDNAGAARGLFRRWCAAFGCLALVLAVSVACVGLWGHEFILGAGWDQAGQMAAILAAAGAAQLVVVPFLGIFAMTGHARDLAKIQVVRVGGLGVLLVICVLVGMPTLFSLSLYACGSVAMYGWLALKLDRLLRELEPILMNEESRL